MGLVNLRIDVPKFHSDPLLGFPFSFGVFQEYYSNHEPFSSAPSGIATVGTTALVREISFSDAVN
jgi:hypothetical protein